jgi:1,4-alpha-glucan branching enzyme
MSLRSTKRKLHPGKESRNVRFVIYAPTARDVHLTGDFNNWNARSTPMLRMENADKGFWSAEIQLTPGSYQYNFFIDGQWVYEMPGGVEVDSLWLQDTLAAELVLSPMGTLNCLVSFR